MNWTKERNKLKISNLMTTFIFRDSIFISIKLMLKKYTLLIKIIITNVNKRVARRIYSRQSRNLSIECITKLKTTILIIIKEQRDKTVIVIIKMPESRKIHNIFNLLKQ